MNRLSRLLSLDEYALIVNEINALTGQFRCKALKALSLTHRSFVPLCQKHIFWRVTYSSRKVARFLDILHVSPHLADYIRDFGYYELTDDYYFSSFVNTQVNVVNTVQLLGKLHNLLSFSMIYTEQRPCGYDWRDLDPQLSDAFLHLILSPNLESLQLCGLQNFPLRGLVELKNSVSLKNLSIGSLEVDPNTLYGARSTDVGLNASDSGSNVRQLSRFAADVSSTIAVEILMGADSPYHNPPIFDFTLLPVICTEWGGGDYKDVISVLIEFASQLEDLRCYLSQTSTMTFKGLATSILKGSFQTIRKLTFSTRTIQTTEHKRDPFYGSIMELTQLAGQMTSLESLDMDFEIFTDDSVDAPENLCEALANRCPEFDRLFADRDAFPKLRSISIYFTLSIVDIDNISTDLKNSIRTIARRLRKSSFKRLDAISTITFSFDLYVQMSILDTDPV